MNIRKLFALLAGVSMVANVVLPGLANAATPDTELGQAYEWAKSKSITTMPTYEAANMYGNITRAELAKMLSNWAMNVKGNTPDESAVCEFSDIDSVKGDLHDFIIKSCQLGLMGQNMPENKFRPYDNISRAEFGTALSRALWEDENNGGTPYYAKHLAALKDAGIMTQISNAESMKEVRGYVMLMLMRSEGNSICEDVVVKVTCAAEAVDGTYKDCPTVCRDNGDNTDTVVKSGDLAVKTVKNEGAKVISSGAVSELDTLTFKATENITLNSITLERYGLSNAESIDAIWLEDEDGNEVTAQKGLSSSKDTVTLTLKKDYKNIGTEASFIVVVRTANANSAELGTNVGFKVIDADSSAKNLDLSNYSANLYDFIDYSGNGVQVEFKGKSGTTTYNYEDGKTYEVAKLRIYATKAAVAVNGFTLTNVGNLDLDNYVDDVEVLVNGTAVKNLKYSLKNDELKVSFDDQEIAINKNETFTVKVSINDDFDKFGNTIKFKLDETTDLNVYEMKNNVRVSVTEKSSGSSVSPAEYAFNGAKISLSNTKLDKTIEGAQGSNDVKVAEGKIAIGGQTLRIEKNTLTLKPSIEADVSSVKLVINGEEYEATAKTSWKVKEKILIEEDSDVKLLVDVDDKATTGDSITFTIGAGNSIFSSTSLAGLVKYDTNGTTVTDMLGSISVSTLKVQEAKGSLTNNISKKVEFKTLETTTKTIFDGTFTAKKQDTHLNTVAIAKVAGTLASADNVTFHVYIDGEEVATFDGVKEEEFSEIVVKAGESVNVKVDADVYASATNTNIQYSLQFKGEDDNNNDISTSAVNMVKMDFVASEGVTVSTNATMKEKDLVLTDSDQVVASFIVKPSNKASTANLDKLVFNVADYISGYTINTNTNADEYFEVVLGDGNNRTTLDLEFDASKKLVADDINEEISGETKVSVIYKKELTNKKTYNLVVEYANGTLSPAKTFSRYAVNALVRVVDQSGDGKSETSYRFGIEFADNVATETVSNVSFMYADGSGSRVWSTIDEDGTYKTPNKKDSPSDATSITYTCDTVTYTITTAMAPDYFEYAKGEVVTRYGY